MVLFKIQLLTYAASVVIQLWSVHGKNSTIATGTATAFLAVVPCYAIARLHFSKAVYELA